MYNLQVQINKEIDVQASICLFKFYSIIAFQMISLLVFLLCLTT